jgi:hypothetical protein
VNGWQRRAIEANRSLSPQYALNVVSDYSQKDSETNKREMDASMLRKVSELRVWPRDVQNYYSSKASSRDFQNIKIEKKTQD